MSTPPFSTQEGCHQLRMSLRRAMPAEAFEPVPWRGVVALMLVPVYVALMALIAAGVMPWWGDVLVGLVIGQIVTSVGLTAHEVMHRSSFRSNFMQRLTGWIGFCWYGISAGTWHAWHVLAHHGNTQDGDADPDRLMTLERYRSGGLARAIHAVTPGSGTLISRVSLCFLFTMQAQLFLWYYCDQPEYSKIRINRWRERAFTLIEVAAWVALAAAMGPWAALCAILIPMLVSNATLMMYISTNHWLRPITPDHNNPFTNTTSVIVHPFVDWVHVAFSYHQEHHIFPQMSPKYAPLLRQKLLELEPAAVTAYPLGAVMREIFRTPSIYLDDHTLVREDGSGAVTVEEIDARLRAEAGALRVAPAS
ncbi:MAG TPA: fatty acid desaturase [Myxococcota bacterium]|nr:fatty acid desaturase [Myxococcota bacterium]